MKTFFLILLSFSALAISASAQAKTIENAILRVEAGKSLDLKASDLAKLARREVRAKDHDGKEAVYTGVALGEVLKLADAKIGNNQLRGKELANFLLVEAADGYRAVFALTELDSEFTERTILLAEAKDGKPLSEKEGRWQIIVPDEKRHGRWVRQVVRLTVKKADSVNETNTTSKTSELSEEDKIREILFKKIMESWMPNSENKLKAFYLSVDDRKDPSESLLKRFSDYRVSVKKVSEADVSSVGEGSAVKEGVIFNISNLEWKNKDEVQADAGSYLGNMGSDNCRYTLKREGGNWKVISKEGCVVS